MIFLQYLKVFGNLIVDESTVFLGNASKSDPHSRRFVLASIRAEIRVHHLADGNIV